MQLLRVPELRRGAPSGAQEGAPAHGSLSAGPGGTCLTGAAPTLTRWRRSAARPSSSKVAPRSPAPGRESGGPRQGLPPQLCAVPAGRYFWRLNRDRHLVSLQPAQMHRFWRGLPPHLDGVDAVYERTIDGKIVFFKGGAPGCPHPTLSSQGTGGSRWFAPGTERRPCVCVPAGVFAEHRLRALRWECCRYRVRGMGGAQEEQPQGMRKFVPG